MIGETIVVGAINVDLVVAVDTLPGPGETVVGGDLSRYGGGKGANAAVAAARAGARVRLIGAVGDDDFGMRALAELRDEGVVVEDVSVLEGAASGVALIVVSADGENQIAVAAGANMAVGPETVRTAIERAKDRVECLIVSTEIDGSAVSAAVHAATSAGIACLLNPAPVIPEVVDLLALGPILTPNASECEALADALSNRIRPATPVGWEAGIGDLAGTRHESVARAALLVAAHTKAPVVVTLGAYGVLVVDAGGSLDLVTPRPTTVVDTTGAGDTFNGVLGTWIGRGATLAAAVRAATAAASLSVASAGARGGMPTASTIEGALGEEDGLSRANGPILKP